MELPQDGGPLEAVQTRRIKCLLWNDVIQCVVEGAKGRRVGWLDSPMNRCHQMRMREVVSSCGEAPNATTYLQANSPIKGHRGERGLTNGPSEPFPATLQGSRWVAEKRRGDSRRGSVRGTILLNEQHLSFHFISVPQKFPPHFPLFRFVLFSILS